LAQIVGDLPGFALWVRQKPNLIVARNFVARNGAGGGNIAGDRNTALGTGSNLGSGGLNYATVIGAEATVSNSDTIVLGKPSGIYGGDIRPADTVRIPGNLIVTGSVSKSSGSFRIDHPLDLANKYLYHSFLESPDMMNVYNGNAVTNETGEAEIVLPDYFEALKRDFRYQSKLDLTKACSEFQL